MAQHDPPIPPAVVKHRLQPGDKITILMPGGDGPLNPIAKQFQLHDDGTGNLVAVGSTDA
jgi:hypothetical protein